MKISIITTAYNVENYIKQCLDSIFAQSYSNIELILVNDCSTDNTMEIVNNYDDKRLIIINHEQNMGAGWSRRHGIEAATGDYIITIDGDDWISEDFIEKLVLNAKETNADIVSGGITIVNSEKYWEIKRFLPCISYGKNKITDYGDGKIVFLNNKLVRKSMYEIVPYCTRRYCEDTPVIIPLLYYANMVSYVDTQGYFYRQHQNSLCKKTDVFQQSLFKALCCQDLMIFFSDKDDEYKNMININEILMYLKIINDNLTEENGNKYDKELNELKPLVRVMTNKQKT